MGQKPWQTSEKNENWAGREIFTQAAQIRVQTPAYLKTRVLAEVRERQQRRRRLTFWKALSGLSLGVSAVLAVLLIVQGPVMTSGFQASVAQPYLVRVEMSELNDKSIAEAEIELPDGVYFHSKSFPELSEKRSLRIAWEGGSDQPVLPFVIRGEKTGRQMVRVRFFDVDEQVVAEKMIEIRFLGSKES